MNDLGQLQPLRTAVCELRGGQYCGSPNISDTAVCDATISLRPCSCSRPRLAVFKHRQTSVTSGDSGLSLDPITEHHDSGEMDVEDNCTRCSQAVMINETCNGRKHECTCAPNDNPSDESDLMNKSVCERHPPNTTEKIVSGSRGSEPYAIGRPRIFRNGRVRTRSESCVGDNIVIPARNLSNFASSCTNCHPQQQFGKTFNGMDEFRQKEFYDSKEIHVLRRRYRQLFYFTAFVFIISSVSIGIAIVGYSNNGSKFNDVDSKIGELQGSMRQKQTSSIPPGMIAAKNKPHIHLQLNGSRQMRATRWNGKVLSWLTDVSQSDDLHYNRDTYTVTVREAGSYFVYNQIYVARMIYGQERVRSNLSNQTVMHTIYKIPFNFPSNRKPVIVAESVLTHCWDEDATTQIHASYLGIIVNVRRNEQLLIALESFHESVDNLMPANTFFGMFKL